MVSGSDRRYRRLSLWHDSLPGSWGPRPALPGDRDADVAIVGAGYTGLWTAYYLKQRDPALRVVVLEREVAGFGASGRNGGWCSAIFPATLRKVAARSSRPAAAAMQRAMNATVLEVQRVTADEGIDCDFRRGGYLSMSRNAAQLARARHEVEEWRAWGFGDDQLRLLSADELRERARVSRGLGGIYTPHCAALHPAKLVRGLAEVVERQGTAIYEQTAVTAIEPGRAETVRGRVRAEVMVRATEGYTAQLPGQGRAIVPVYSLMVGTEPLPAAFWDGVGLAHRETFSDERHLRIYGQRTADGRFAFGGRGAPYHMGSRVRPAFDRNARVHSMLRRILLDLFPAAAGVRFTHAWGGNLGIPRDWYPAVRYDARSGLASAGGYVGDGVATSNLAGRTLADLITRTDSELVRLPWVGRRSRDWEPEPLRWLGVNAATLLFALADRTEARTGRPSRAAAGFWRVLGH